MTKRSGRTFIRRNHRGGAMHGAHAALADELDAMKLLFDFGNRLQAAHSVTQVAEEMLDAALEVLGSFMGYVRLDHAGSGTLELAAHRGIRQEFFDYFLASNTDESAICARALQSGERVVIEDVQTTPFCAHLQEHVAAPMGYRALLATPLPNGNGRRLGVLCTHFRQPHNPSERELRMLDLYGYQAAALIGRLRAEEALRDSEARFRSLADASPALIWQLAPDGRPLFLNSRHQDLTGIRTHELMQSGWRAILHPDDGPPYLDAVSRAQSERARLQQRVRVKCNRGCWRLLESYALPWFGAGGEYAGHVGISIDITDATDLEQSQTTYRMATEGGNEGFYILRPVHDANKAIVDFDFIDSNHCGAIYLGYRRENLIGKKVSALHHDAGSLERSMKILRRAMKLGFYEDDVEVSPGGLQDVRWVHCKIVRSRGDLAVTLRDVSRAKARVDELERRGNEDALTGLPNRYWVQHYLPQAIEQANAGMSELALLFMDLDGFKQVNDTAGHPAGDELLRMAARRLKVAVRPQDKVARVGGDEFVVILENMAHRADAAHVADRILHAFSENFTTSQGHQRVGVSIGISLFPSDAKDADTLLRNADMAMYSVKSNGKRNYRFFGQECVAHTHPA